MIHEEEYRHDDSLQLEEASELASLLSNSPKRPCHRRHRENSSVSSITSSVSTIILPRAQKKASVTNILYFITFIASYSGGFIEQPLTRLIEDLICHDYYNVKSSTEPIDERLCKVDSIQKQLAYLLAVQSTLYSIVAFVVAFPWGLAADKLVPGLVGLGKFCPR
jgi:hypothetical protein